MLSDITRLKTQQAELERLARDRELMFSLSEVGIAFVRQGCIQRANEALAQLTGRSVEELLLSPLSILFADSADLPAPVGARGGRAAPARALDRRAPDPSRRRPADLGPGQPAAGARGRSEQRHDRRLRQCRRSAPRRAGGGAAGRAHARDPRFGAGGHRHRRAARHRMDEPLGAAHVRRRPGRFPEPADRHRRDARIPIIRSARPTTWTTWSRARPRPSSARSRRATAASSGSSAMWLQPAATRPAGSSPMRCSTSNGAGWPRPACRRRRPRCSA